MGYHCKKLPVPRDWNFWFPTLNLWVIIARNCRVLFGLLVRYRMLCFAYLSGIERFVLFHGAVHIALFCVLVRYKTLCFVSWSGTNRFVLLIGPVHNVLFWFLVRYKMLCFAYWSGIERFVLLIGPVQIALFCLLVRFRSVRYRKLCFAYWSGTDCFVLLIGPVQIALFCLLVRYRKLCFAYWCGTERFVLLNGFVPKFESASSQARNHRLPLQATPVSRSSNLSFRTSKTQNTIAMTCRFPEIELLVPNLGTIGYHCKELRVPRDRNSWFLTLEP